MELLIKILPALLVLNIVLSAIGQGLAVLGKQQIPMISQASDILKKIVDFLSANSKH